MNLYLYSEKKDLTNQQIQLLQKYFNKVIFINKADYSKLFNDKVEKIVAINPDIIDWRLENSIIEKIPNLKAICLQSTGFDWIDCEFCKKRNIVVANVPNYCTNSVAEKVLFMALALAKKFPIFEQEGKMKWAPEFIADDMQGAQVGIVGLGAIGTCLAQKLESVVGVKNICYYSHKNSNKRYCFVEFDELLKKSEYVFVTLSKNKESLALFDDLSKFNKKSKVIIIANAFKNIAESLAKKCEKGEIAGIAFESDENTKFKGNVFITPHNAYYTKKSLENMFDIWLNTIISTTKNKITNKVN